MSVGMWTDKIRNVAVLAEGETRGEEQEQALLRRDYPRAYELMLTWKWQREREQENEIEELMMRNGR
jgi:hypothetical protein